MSRRSQAPKRQILPDPKHNSEMLAKFINMIMCDGKKSVAEGIVYGALEQISTRTVRGETLTWNFSLVLKRSEVR